MSSNLQSNNPINPNSNLYNFAPIESKWQKLWQEQQVFEVQANNRPKFYVLEMFPYPSGQIHMGHVRNYAIGDVLARYKRANGFNVLHPLGWDSFGLPAENAAKEKNINPAVWTINNIKTMKADLTKIGLSIDWDREIITSSPDYFKHEQKMFIEFYKHGLAYKKQTTVNWDPIENTVLANEQVVNGKGWRSGAEIVPKKLNQWFLKITSFAEDLLAGLDQLKNWPSKVVTMQKNWIGKSTGAEVTFKLTTSIANITNLQVFTTRVDTIYGVSFIGLSTGHPISEILAQNNLQIQEFINKVNVVTVSTEKLGINTNLTVIHPLTKQEIPIFITNFVLNNYGCGAICGVPAHDERDFDFAQKHFLPIKTVVAPAHQLDFTVTTAPFTEAGIAINSERLNGLVTSQAKEKALQLLQDLNIAQAKTNFKLRDWGISRQRYWGCPIPIIYCNNCGMIPEDENNLPIKLPEDIDFSKVQGNPLENHPTWKHTTCPKCKAVATRETDTFDTFVESSWYFLKYTNSSKDIPFTQQDIKDWLPVNIYIGGIEHAIMHLLYSRFFMLALNKINYLSHPFEPFNTLITQGMICHKTYKNALNQWIFPTDVVVNKQGQIIDKNTNTKVTVGVSEKMSKSKKNTISPTHICQKYGADTARLFVLADAPPNNDLDWCEEGLEGTWKFINKLWKLSNILNNIPYKTQLDIDSLTSEEFKLLKFTHKTIQSVSLNIDNFLLNKAIANIRELFNLITSTYNNDNDSTVVKHAFCTLLQLINPFAPHLSEEIWYNFGLNPILACHQWPSYNPKLIIDDVITIAVQFNGKTRGTLQVKPAITQEELLSLINEDSKLIKFLLNKPLRKVIYVKGKIINIII